MFSKSFKYAVRASLYLAVNGNESHKIGVKEIAEKLNVPLHFLAKILQQLARHKLISSVKGPNGGFYLNENNRSVTLEEMVECMDGSEVFQACILGLPVCSSDNPCPLHTQAFAYREGLRLQFHYLTIDALAKRILAEKLRV